MGLWQGTKNKVGGFLKKLKGPEPPSTAQSDAAHAQSTAQFGKVYDNALGASSGYYSPGTIQGADMSPATNLLRQSAMGEGPSAAASQYQAALGQASQQGQALAAGGRGAERGALRLQAMQGAGDRAAVGAQQSAALRAQEMQQAQTGYATALQQQGQLTQDASKAQEEARRLGFDSTSKHQGSMLDIANRGATGGLDVQRSADENSAAAYQQALNRYNGKMQFATTVSAGSIKPR